MNITPHSSSCALFLAPLSTHLILGPIVLPDSIFVIQLSICPPLNERGSVFDRIAAATHIVIRLLFEGFSDTAGGSK